MRKRALFVCTGNSVRSQMAEALVGHDFAGDIETYSAGTAPTGLNPYAVEVMAEVGIDISGARSEHLGDYEGQEFDYVITLCDSADRSCPQFYGGVKRLHMGFPDPLSVSESPEAIREHFRTIRDAIRDSMREFFSGELKAAPGEQ